MKIRPLGAELIHADGRTDMTKVIGAFLNYAKVSKVINEIWQVVEDMK
jgi:hypothetical protein